MYCSQTNPREVSILTVYFPIQDRHHQDDLVIQVVISQFDVSRNKASARATANGDDVRRPVAKRSDACAKQPQECRCCIFFFSWYVVTTAQFELFFSVSRFCGSLFCHVWQPLLISYDLAWIASMCLKKIHKKNTNSIYAKILQCCFIKFVDQCSGIRFQYNAVSRQFRISDFLRHFEQLRHLIEFSVVMTLSLKSSEYNVQALRGRYLNLGMASNQ